MTFTYEVRWFHSGPLPDALGEWFDTLGPVTTSTQSDLYLPTEDPALNLKLRDDQFQIKRRMAGPHHYAFSGQAAGQCEQWLKWSFGLRDVPALWDRDPTDLWIRLDKTRRQLTIAPDQQSTLSDDLPTTPPASIEMELTTVEAGDQRSWTFCLETEGPIASLADTLQAAAPLLLDDRLPVPLADDHSFGYVRWLQQLPSVSLHPAPDIQVSE